MILDRPGAALNVRTLCIVAEGNTVLRLPDILRQLLGLHGNLVPYACFDTASSIFLLERIQKYLHDFSRDERSFCSQMGACSSSFSRRGQHIFLPLRGTTIRILL